MESAHRSRMGHLYNEYAATGASIDTVPFKMKVGCFGDGRKSPLRSRGYWGEDKEADG